MGFLDRLLGIPNTPASTNGHVPPPREDPDWLFYTSPRIFSNDIALAVPGEFVVTRSPADRARPSVPREARRDLARSGLAWYGQARRGEARQGREHGALPDSAQAADRATQRAYARQLRAQGHSTMEIAERLGVSQPTAWRWSRTPTPISGEGPLHVRRGMGR